MYICAPFLYICANIRSQCGYMTKNKKRKKTKVYHANSHSSAQQGFSFNTWTLIIYVLRLSIIKHSLTLGLALYFSSQT